MLKDRSRPFSAALFTLFLILAPLGALGSTAVACDTCGCTAIPLDGIPLLQGLQLGISEQFTSFDRLRQDSAPVPNVAHQYFNSSVTQLIVSYNVNDRFGLLLNLPFVARSYSRLLDGVAQRGNVSGLGDITLQGRWAAIQNGGPNGFFNLNVLGGVKLPTGSSGFLKEQAAALQGGPDSVVGGHDLTLGSGSVDEILGSSLYWRNGRFLLTANTQFAFRNTGAYGYRYANEFQWDIAPGTFLVYETDSRVALQLSFNGTIKDQDTFNGSIPVTDTAINEVNVGPRITATWNNKLTTFLDANLPLHQSNSGLQPVPSYRIHGGVNFRF